MIVVDASAIVEFVFGTAAGRRIGKRLAAAKGLHAPHLVDLEVIQTVKRYEPQGLGEHGPMRVLADFMQIPIHRHGHGALLERIWELRHNVSAYDATYLALAEHLGAVVLTRDRRLARAPGHRATVEVI